MMRHGYIFRIDDVHPSMDWLAFQRYMDLFGSYGVVPLIGIIPDCRDPDLKKQKERETFWEDMRALAAAGKVEISLHGFRHVYGKSHNRLFDRLVGRFPQSEFCGIPLEMQRSMIAQGKAILDLQGLHTDVFMAPSHTMDANTRRALAENGFTTVTDGIALYPYRKDGLCFVPQQQWSPERIRAGIITVCYHPGDYADTARLKVTEAFLQNAPPVMKFSEAAAYVPTWSDRLMNGYFLARYIASLQIRRLLGSIFKRGSRGK